LPTRQTGRGRASPCGRAGADTARPHKRRSRRPCHYRAIHSGPGWSPPDNHGQRHSGLDLRRFLPSQVTKRADLALQAGGQLVEACIGLAVPGRPIGPWSRRTGAPEASATGRDRTPRPMLGPWGTGPQGHERSPTVKKVHRSTSLQLRQLAQRGQANQIVVPKAEDLAWRSRSRA
jgi:hypothetical protein